MPTYNADHIVNLDSTTPTTGTWTVPEVDDAIREIKRAVKNDVPKIIRGTINNGAIVVGTGFTCSRTNTGIYRITFSTAFSSAPSIVANYVYGYAGSNIGVVYNNGATTTYSDIILYNAGTFAAMDGGFSFIAIGPA